MDASFHNLSHALSTNRCKSEIQCPRLHTLKSEKKKPKVKNIKYQVAPVQVITKYGVGGRCKAPLILNLGTR
jgi:hypothetical protein